MLFSILERAKTWLKSGIISYECIKEEADITGHDHLFTQGGGELQGNRRLLHPQLCKPKGQLPEGKGAI